MFSRVTSVNVIKKKQRKNERRRERCLWKVSSDDGIIRKVLYLLLYLLAKLTTSYNYYIRVTIISKILIILSAAINEYICILSINLASDKLFSILIWGDGSVKIVLDI